MSDATISSTSPGPEARGRDSPPGSPVAQFDRHAGNDVVHGPDRDVRAKRRRSLTDNEIRGIADRLGRNSCQPEGDLALFYLLLTTGAKPLELARLRVKDVIAPSGTIRSEACLPARASINGVARPVFFKSEVAVEAIMSYVRYRVAKGHGVGTATRYAGLAPASPLLLNGDGRVYRIVESSDNGCKRYLCRGILEACRRIFRNAGIDGLCASTLRRTLARRLRDRGATLEQIGQALGITDRKAIRDLLDVRHVDLSTLFDEIVCANGTTPAAVDHHRGES
jgi:integrase